VLHPYFWLYLRRVNQVTAGPAGLVIVYLVIQQIDAALISPRVLGKRVGLHPLFVILALLAGAQLYGFTGLILSVPLLAVLRAIFIFVSRKLLPEER